MRRAVVLGSSVAGLTAAAALVEHVDEVLVLERDTLPSGVEHRRGTPQSRHPHFLLHAGREAIEDLLPGTTELLLRAGARDLDPAVVTATCEARGWAPRVAGSLRMLYTSRILLEKVLRDQVRRLDGVQIREGETVTGVALTAGATRVVGVDVEGRSGPLSVECDLVVDAMGRGSSIGRWLVAAGVPPVPDLTLNAKVMYSSRWYDAPSADTRPAWLWWEHLAVLPLPGTGREEDEYLSTVFPVEDGRWIAFMGSWGHEMPTTTQEFDRRADRLRTPVFARMLEHAHAAGDVHVTRATSNVWRRFDRATDLPTGLVGVGDAVCAFNPLYGQGMSAAAVSARILRDTLRAGGHDVESRYFRAQAEFLRRPWSLAVARDRTYDHASGTEVMSQGWRKRLAARAVWPVFGLVSQASREDDVVARHFGALFNLQQDMSEAVRSPRFLAGLVRYAVKRGLARTRLPEYSPADGLPSGVDHTRRPHSATGRAVGVG